MSSHAPGARVTKRCSVLLNIVVLTVVVITAPHPVNAQTCIGSVFSTFVFFSGGCATGTNTFAAGASAVASGTNSIALGSGAQATNNNSVAIGASAATTRDSQVAIGGPGTTITVPSISSAGAKSAQSGPLSFVTTDSNGNLASANPPTGTVGPTTVLTTNNGQQRKLNDGVALAIAGNGAPGLLPGRSFALNGNVGAFNGSKAVSFSTTVLLQDQPGYAVVGNAGVGVAFRTGTVGGHGGVSFQW